MARNNVIRMNTLHLNSVRLNGIGEVQSVSLSAGADPEQPPVGNYIQFEDPAVEAICVANWSSDGIGLTMEDAAAVTSIGTIFKGNTEITSFDEFKYFTGVTTIKEQAFRGCTALESIVLRHVQTIERYAFRNCSALEIEVDMPNLGGVLQYGTFTKSGIKSVKSLGNITSITGYDNETGAFGDCLNLVEVNLPDSLTTIGAHAFTRDTSLTIVKYDWSRLVSLGAGAFNNCTSLYFDELNLANLTTLDQNALYGVKIKKLNLGKVTALPTGASGKSQYYGDKNTLEEVIIPEGVTEIPALSFANYVNLSKCELSKVTFIGGSAMHSTAITEQYLPNVETIDKNAFQNCTKLRLVDIGDKCTAINLQAFKVCTALESLVVRATTPPTAGAEILISTTCLIYVPDESVDAYKAATNWSSYSDRIHPLSEIEGVVIEHNVKVNTNTGAMDDTEGWSTLKYVQITGGHTLAWGVQELQSKMGPLVEYTEAFDYVDYWLPSTNPRTITTNSTSRYVCISFKTDSLDYAYLYDSTDGKYLYKGQAITE